MIPWFTPLDTWQVNRALKLRESDLVVNALEFDPRRGPLGCYVAQTSLGEIAIEDYELRQKRSWQEYQFKNCIDWTTDKQDLFLALSECNYESKEPIDTKSRTGISARYKRIVLLSTAYPTARRCGALGFSASAARSDSSRALRSRKANRRS